jgi:hypothetical protein
MVVDVCLLCVVTLFSFLTVIVTMGDLVVVVLVGVPEDPVLHPTGIIDVMGDVPVVMVVGDGWVGVLCLSTVAFCVLLLSHGSCPFGVVGWTRGLVYQA